MDIEDLGKAAGVVLGGPVGLAAQLVPTLVRWIGGDKAGEVAEKVTAVAQDVFGTSDANAIQNAMAKDPAALYAFRTRLAEIDSEYDQRRIQELEARLADVANARAQTVELAKTNSPIAWGAPIISAIVMAMLGYVLIVITQSTLPPGQERIVDLTIGTLLSMASGVVGYWVGNSIGARQSAETMRQITEKVAGRS